MLVVYLVVPRSWRNVLLLGTSLVFYGWGEADYLWLILLSICGNYFFGLLLGRSRGRRLALTLAVAFNLSPLGVFKYAGMFGETVEFLARDSDCVPEIRGTAPNLDARAKEWAAKQAKTKSLCDSFVFDSLRFFLSEAFSEVHYVHHGSGRHEAVIRTRRPDVVLCIVAERSL